MKSLSFAKVCEIWKTMKRKKSLIVNSKFTQLLCSSPFFRIYFCVDFQKSNKIYWVDTIYCGQFCRHKMKKSYNECMFYDPSLGTNVLVVDQRTAKQTPITVSFFPSVWAKMILEWDYELPEIIAIVGIVWNFKFLAKSRNIFEEKNLVSVQDLIILHIPPCKRVREGRQSRCRLL